MKKQLLPVFWIIACMIFNLNPILAQSKGFKYQAVARDTEGNPLKERDLTITIEIYKGNANGEMVWQEKQNLITTNTGHFSMTICSASSNNTGGTYNNPDDINWGSDAHFIGIRLKDGNNDFDMGKSELLSVPYAAYAENGQVGPQGEQGPQGPKGDPGDPATDDQKLSINDHTLSISGGNSITLPDNTIDGDADSSNELQSLELNGDLLSLSDITGSVNLASYFASQNPWSKGDGYISYNNGSIGVGTVTPEAVMDVVGSDDQEDTEAIFQVKNNANQTVFAVYNEGVRIYIPDDASYAKGIKSGFAVGGYNSTKALDQDEYFMSILPDGTNINFFSDENSKGIKSGFAVGGYNSTKSNNSSFIYMDPYAVPATTVGGLVLFPLSSANSPKANCYIGTLAGANHKGWYNTSLGYQSGYNLNGYYSISFPSGESMEVASSNTTVGAFAGYSNDYGDGNVYLGYEAGASNLGSKNVFIGYRAGKELEGIDNQLFITNNDGSDQDPLIWGDFESEDIQLNGEVGIGVTPSATYGLRVNGGSSPSYAMYVYKGAYFAGSIRVVGTTYASDRKYKKNIRPFNNSLGILNQLQGVHFDWRKEKFEGTNFDNKPQIGFIAQDVEEVLPEIVATDDDGYKSVDYAKMTVILVEAVKEQQSQIEALQQTIKNQQNEIEALSEEHSGTEIENTIADLQKTIKAMSERINAMEQLTDN